MKIKHFPQVKFDKERPAQQLYLHAWKFYKVFKYYFVYRADNTGLKQIEKFAKAHSAMDEFVNRLGERPFHGESQPDAVDFRAYTIVAKYNHTWTV